MKKRLEKLINATPVVSHTGWPQRTDEFNNMSKRLQAAASFVVQKSAWDNSNLEDWMWSVYSQRFHFDVVSTFRLGPNIDDRTVIVRSHFGFDPAKPWYSGMLELSVDVKKYTDALLLMQRAYYASIEGAS